MPETRKGNRHIITAIDYATRWVVAKAVPNRDAATVAKFIYEDLLINYGAPYEIITDRASAFVCAAMDEYLELQKVKHLASSPYHPQTNGMVERMHAMLGHSITTLTRGKPDRWDEFLAQTMFALRVRTHAVTGFSPFYLLYGVDPRLPGDVDPPRASMEPLSELEQREARREHHARLFESIGMDRAAAWERGEAQAERMRTRNPTTEGSTETHHFKVGEWVKMKHHARTKFEFDWKGPYFVVELGHPRTYRLMTPAGRRLESQVNENDLAPWRAQTSSNVSFFYDGTQASGTIAATTPVPSPSE